MYFLAPGGVWKNYDSTLMYSLSTKPRFHPGRINLGIYRLSGKAMAEVGGFAYHKLASGCTLVVVITPGVPAGCLARHDTLVGRQKGPQPSCPQSQALARKHPKVAVRRVLSRIGIPSHKLP